jgi:uncharacterized protein YjbI with pentapeptide repeats
MAKVNPGAAASKTWAAIGGFLRKRWLWLVAALLLLALLVLIYAGYWAPWTGFGQRLGTVSEEDRAKTLWDWLDLLLVPVLLALGAWFLNRAAREREHRTDLDRSRQAALQTCLDRITILLRDKWRESGGGFLEANIIRAQTLTVLRQLDGERKGLLLQFLYESGLIGKLKKGKRQQALVDLRRADLRRADLRGADLTGADLRGASLSGANLRVANLIGANLPGAFLIGANLPGAFLSRAFLRGAILSRAVLSRAVLSWAVLSRAFLTGAVLRGAVLTGADLTGADLTDTQLAQAKSLEGVTLPDGTKHRSKGPSESEEVPGAAGRGNDGAC